MSTVTSEMGVNSDRVVHLAANENLSPGSCPSSSTKDGVRLHGIGLSLASFWHLPRRTHTMPTHTDRQLAADALHRAFLVNFIADLESQELDYTSDSEGDDSDDSDDSMDGSGSSSNSSATSSSSESSSEDSDFMTPAETYVHHMGNLYYERYMAERTEIPKTQELMRLLLGEYKDRFPHIFQSYLHIDPDCFDSLVDAIHDDEIFHNNSNNSQMPVDEQVVIVLFRFGHYGNAASLMKVALQFGVGFGTVHLVTT